MLKNTIFEKKVYLMIRSLKDPVLRPIVALLAFVRVTPTMVTAAGILCMVLFAWMLPVNLTWALWAFLGAVVADWLDGSLARFTHTESPFGKLTDFLADYTTFSIFIFGLAQAHLVDTAWAVLFVYFAVLAKILILLNKNASGEIQWKDWLTKPVGGAFPHFFMFLSYFLFVIYALFRINYLPVAIMLSSLVLAADAAYHYYQLKKLKQW